MGDKVMQGVSYTGAVASVVSGLTLTEWGIVVGIATAILTFAANMFYQARKDQRDKDYKHQRNQREQHLHDLEVQFIYQARQEAADEGGQQ